jgi:acetyltransferase-like isoleucine patch superfamily enzyme
MSQVMQKETYVVRQRLFEENTSKAQKYQDLIVGKKGFLNLLKHELILLLSSWVPGALGLFLRSKLYPVLIGEVGKSVIFGTNIVLRHPHKIRIGTNTVIDDNCVLDAKGSDNKGIVIGNNVFVGRNTILMCTNGDINIEDNVSIGFNSDVFSGRYVSLGRNTLISAYCFLNGSTHFADRTDIPISEQGSFAKGITLEDNVWLAANVKVLDGVTIGRDAIVGAGAVVNRDLPPFSVAAGVPAKVIRSRMEPNASTVACGQE